MFCWETQWIPFENIICILSKVFPCDHIFHQPLLQIIIFASKNGHSQDQKVCNQIDSDWAQRRLSKKTPRKANTHMTQNCNNVFCINFCSGFQKFKICVRGSTVNEYIPGICYSDVFQHFSPAFFDSDNCSWATKHSRQSFLCSCPCPRHFDWTGLHYAAEADDPGLVGPGLATGLLRVVLPPNHILAFFGQLLIFFGNS